MSPKLSSGTSGRISSRIAARALPGAIPAPSSSSPFPRPFLRTLVLGWVTTTSVASSASQLTSRRSKPGTFLSQYASMLERGVRAWLPENASVRKWQANPSVASASPSRRSSGTWAAAIASLIASRWSWWYWASPPNGLPPRVRLAFSARLSSRSPTSGLEKCLMLRVLSRW